MGVARKVLSISPHADDSEYGCGAFLAQAADRGDDVTLALVGASDYTAANGKQVLGKVREAEQKAACDLLGVKYEFMGFALENRYSEVPYADFVDAFQLLISKVWPDVLLIPLPSFNQDHRAVYDALITALRPSKVLRCVPNVLAYELPCQNWGPPVPTTGLVYVPHKPEFLGRKVSALACHKSQGFSEHGIMGADSVKALAKRRGWECGADQAELFYGIRMTGL